jgi:integrase
MLRRLSRERIEPTKVPVDSKGVPAYTTEVQMADILSACEKYGNKARGGKYTGPENARRIRAFVLLLRYSGLRIGDAVTLERRRIIADKLLLYTAKTGTPAYLPLPSFVLTALEAMPRISETYFFWTGGPRFRAPPAIGSEP